MKKFKLYYCITFVFLYIITGKFSVTAQQGNPCLQNFPNGWSLEITDYGTGIKDIAPIADVNYYRKIVNPNQYEYFIDWSNLTFSNEGLSEKSLKEIIELFIVNYHTPCSQVGGFVPPYPDYTRTHSFYYTKKCSYIKTSILKMKHENAGVCCDDENDSYGHLTYLGEWYELYKTIESCGTKCCRKDYITHCITRNGVKVVEVDPVSTFTISECDGTVVPKCTDPSLPLHMVPDPVCTSGCD